jgi:hypothetical protein
LVRNLFAGERLPGTYSATWDGRCDRGNRSSAVSICCRWKQGIRSFAEKCS